MEQYSTCTRCGTSIKHTFEFNGAVYGSECITAVLGIRPDKFQYTNGAVDIDKTREMIAAKEAKVQAQLVENARLEQEQEAREVKYTALNAEVISVLEQSGGAFANDMADCLKAWSITTLSDRQFQIVGDIFAKYFGRRNSKAYNEAWDRFEVIGQN